MIGGSSRPKTELLAIDDEERRPGRNTRMIGLAPGATRRSRSAGGTDFHPGINGIGPKKALALVKRHGAIEHMPARFATGSTAM
jgi:hypothetical protein